MDFTRPERSPTERTRQEDRHSKFYETSDNLPPAGPTGMTAASVTTLLGPYIERVRGYP
jgi:hypothetical protein